MKRLDFITIYTSFTKEHLTNLKKSIELGMPGNTWGAIEALNHCDIITVFVDDSREINKLEQVLTKSGYVLLEKLVL